MSASASVVPSRGGGLPARRAGNHNVEQGFLSGWLQRQGHSEKRIGKALFELDKAAALGGATTLYEANRDVYGLLRYGVKVRPDIGEQAIRDFIVFDASIKKACRHNQYFGVKAAQESACDRFCDSSGDSGVFLTTHQGRDRAHSL